MMASSTSYAAEVTALSANSEVLHECIQKSLSIQRRFGYVNRKCADAPTPLFMKGNLLDFSFDLGLPKEREDAAALSSHSKKPTTLTVFVRKLQ